jgi:hypothetical protein
VLIVEGGDRPVSFGLVEDWPMSSTN